MNVIAFFEGMKRCVPSADALQKAGISAEHAGEVYRSLVPEVRSFPSPKDSEDLLRQFYQVFDLKKLSFGGVSFFELPERIEGIIIFGSAADYTLALSDGEVIALEGNPHSRRWKCADSFGKFSAALIKASEFFTESALDHAFWQSQEKRTYFARECALIAGGCLEFYFHLFGVSGGDWAVNDFP
jgi:hypothetical protein